MACQQTHLDTGKPCNNSIKRSSCTDCGKIGESNQFVAPHNVCPCECLNKTAALSSCAQRAPNRTLPCSNFESKCGSLKQSNTPTARQSSQPNKEECGKLTWWQWLLSLVGLYKNDCNKTDDNLKDKKSLPAATSPTRVEKVPTEGTKDESEAIKKPEAKRVESSPGVPHDEQSGDAQPEKVPEEKKKTTKKRTRSQSADSKSRNKYLGRPLEPTPKRRGSSNQKEKSKSPKKSEPTSAQSGKASKSPVNTAVAEKSEEHPPISPVYSSEKYLKVYSPHFCPPACEEQDSQPLCPQQTKTKQQPCYCDILAGKTKDKACHKENKCPGEEAIEESIRSMSCPSPCCLTPCCCEVCCCCCEPCCEPSITTLMRKRCPSPSKTCKKRSRSCTSPRNLSECTGLIKKEMSKRCRPAVCQVCCSSPGRGCKCKCVPVQCSPCSCVPKYPPCCSPKGNVETSKSPKKGDFTCQPPCKITTNLSPRISSYGKCPITCMRPCCLATAVPPFSSCCPPSKPACSPPSPTAPKAHTVCCIPKSNQRHPIPPSTATFCSPNSLKSYARSKDGDAYCKFLMSRYNVSVPDYPPLLPMTISGCAPRIASSHAVPEYKRSSCSNSKCGGADTTGNCTDEDYYCCQHSPRKEQVSLKDSPSKKQPVSSFRLPARTPVECIREHGPRSPVREYASKLGLPKKMPRTQTSQPAPEPTEVVEKKEESAEKKSGTDSATPKGKGKSPRKSKTPKQDEQNGEEQVISDDLAKQNISENKTTSEDGTANNKLHHPHHSSISATSRVRSQSSPRSHRVKYTKTSRSKMTCPAKAYNATTTTTTGTTATSVGSERPPVRKNHSFYRNFLGISPKAICNRRHVTDVSQHQGLGGVPDSLSLLKSPTNHSSPQKGSKKVNKFPTAPIQRSKSISPTHAGKTMALCGTPAKTNSPVAPLNSHTIQRKEYTASKVSAPPMHSQKVSLLYNERSLIMETRSSSISGQASLSKKHRKPESPVMPKLKPPSPRGYQHLFLENIDKSRSPTQPSIVKSPKSEPPKTEYHNNANAKVEIKSITPKRRKLSSPSPKDRQNTLVKSGKERRCSTVNRDSCKLENRFKRDVKKPKSPVVALRDEITSLLKDPEENLQDEDSLKTDTTYSTPETYISDLAETKRTHPVIPENPREIRNKESYIVTEAPKTQTPVRQPVVVFIKPLQEKDGSTSVDYVCINTISTNESKPLPVQYTEELPQKVCNVDTFSSSLSESSVDPKHYDHNTPMGESCVDTAKTFNNSGSADSKSQNLCHKKLIPHGDYSCGGHYAPGSLISSSVDSGRLTNDWLGRNVSNNFNTCDGNDGNIHQSAKVKDRIDTRVRKVTAESADVLRRRDGNPKTENDSLLIEIKHNKGSDALKRGASPEKIKNLGGKATSKGAIVQKDQKAGVNRFEGFESCQNTVDTTRNNESEGKVTVPYKQSALIVDCVKRKDSRLDPKKLSTSSKNVVEKLRHTIDHGSYGIGCNVSSSVDGFDDDDDVCDDDDKEYNEDDGGDNGGGCGDKRDCAVDDEDDDDDKGVEDEDCYYENSSDRVCCARDFSSPVDRCCGTPADRYATYASGDGAGTSVDPVVDSNNNKPGAEVGHVHDAGDDGDELSSNSPNEALPPLEENATSGSSLDRDTCASVDPVVDSNNNKPGPEVGHVHDAGDDGDELSSNSPNEALPPLEENATSGSSLDRDTCIVQTKTEQTACQTGAALAQAPPAVMVAHGPCDITPNPINYNQVEGSGRCRGGATGTRDIVLLRSDEGEEGGGGCKGGQLDEVIAAIQKSAEDPSKTDNKNEKKPSILHDLLGNSGVKWQKVGPATEPDIRILRLAKAAIISSANDQAKNNQKNPCPYVNLFKSEKEAREGFREPRSDLLKPEEKEGQEPSVLTRLNNY